MADNPHRQRYPDADVLRFFTTLAHRDPVARSKELSRIVRVFDAWLDGYGSPKDVPAGGSEQNGFAVDQTAVLQEHLLMILHLSKQCPFADVRTRCHEILDDLQDRGRGLRIPRALVKGPSHFIPTCETIPIDTQDDQTENMFVDAYLQNCRLDHITQVMAYHPQYLDIFLRTQNYLLHGDGPLPLQYRHYIAIMAAARHHCTYLIKQQIAEFLLSGGDERWLGGMSYIPQKLRDLSEINRILAHRPWLISSKHIENLTKGHHKWALQELLQAIIIMTNFHALSSFVFGSGINAELDHDTGHTLRPPSVHSDSNNDSDTSCSSLDDCLKNKYDSEPEGGIDMLIERMRRLTEDNDEEPSQEEMLQRFRHIEQQNVEIGALVKPSMKSDFVRFIDQPDFVYEDFAKRPSSASIQTFRAQDYSWDDHGYSLANHLYMEIGTLLNDKFATAYDLTYYTMGDMKDIDTSSFRTAIWNYIHCLYGIRHDDYDYALVNQLLERNLKLYIKTITCFPESVTKRHYDSVMKEFHHSEKIHVNLMMHEARLQAELLYALRAMTNYMT